VLVAGVGNVFLGDDAFGVEVARRLAQRPQPKEVRVMDFGIRGLDLAYELLEGYAAVVLVDAVPRGEAPGTLFVLEPDLQDVQSGNAPMIELHAMDPVKVLRLAASLGGRVEHVLVVGCEPATSECPEFAAEMSVPVRAAVDGAVVLVESLVAQWLRVGGLSGPGARVTVSTQSNTERQVQTCQPLDQTA
jgi:hydrogenase maturation protease